MTWHQALKQEVRGCKSTVSSELDTPYSAELAFGANLAHRQSASRYLLACIHSLLREKCKHDVSSNRNGLTAQELLYISGIIDATSEFSVLAKVIDSNLENNESKR